MNSAVSETWKKVARVGLFDSGVGGLSVLRSLVSRLGPREKQFIYIGDTLRCPYGDRSPEEIQSYVEQLSAWLLQQRVDAIIMACNTSAARARETIDSVCPVPAFDLLRPTARYLASSGLERVGVIATASTASSGAFSRAIHALNPNIEVVEVGCPLLVPVVEAGLARAPEAVEALRPYIMELLQRRVQSIVYGCTHYPFLDEALEELLTTLTDEPVFIVDPAEILAQNFFDWKAPATSLDVRDFGSCMFVTTGDTEKFERTASVCLGAEIGTVANLPIADLHKAAEQGISFEPDPSSPIHLSPRTIS